MNGTPAGWNKCASAMPKAAQETKQPRKAQSKLENGCTSTEGESPCGSASLAFASNASARCAATAARKLRRGCGAGLAGGGEAEACAARCGDAAETRRPGPRAATRAEPRRAEGEAAARAPSAASTSEDIFRSKRRGWERQWLSSRGQERNDDAHEAAGTMLSSADVFPMHWSW